MFTCCFDCRPVGAGRSHELPRGDLPPRRRTSENGPGKEGSASVTVRSNVHWLTYKMQRSVRNAIILFINLVFKLKLTLLPLLDSLLTIRTPQ